YTARSALGEDAAGDIIFAASMSAIPVDMANALVASGVVEGMQMDINPEWITLDLTTNPGYPINAVVPGQQRPSNQYVVGWSRDFVAVLASP
ncbi:MAG: hypothetical protein ACREQ5_33995, partial [Candidatus Dormibacteria bacterium]